MSMRCADDRGYAMAALLVGMSVMAIMLSVAMPAWRTAVQREREAELIFRGEQYAHAIELFSRRNGGFPPSLDVLEKGRFICKLYKDPMTGEGDFQPVYVGQAIAGQPVVPGQAGRGAVGGGPAGAASGRMGQTPTAGGRGAPAAAQFPGVRAGQPPGGVAGQPGTTIGAGPIIGVVSKSPAESLRLYNGRGHYNEWAFVAIVTTTQPGAPGGGQNPGAGRGGRGAGQDAPGRGNPGGLGQRRGEPPPGRGGPGRGGPGPGRGNPFGSPGGFPFPGGQQPGRAPLP
jgi:type II secretory pathway pseudopilin PulG